MQTNSQKELLETLEYRYNYKVLKTRASLQNHVTVGTTRYRYWSPLIGQLSPFYKHVAVPVVVKKRVYVQTGERG
jgi:hypothetical protein